MNGARYAFLNRMCELVKAGEDIVIVTSDYAAPSLDEFRNEYADRYISVGIAEQNLIQIACGLAMCGKKVVAYGMAPFPCIRAVDQIKNAAAMMHLPISIVVAGVGFAIPEFGATHYNTEDISMIRAIPGIDIINVSDNTMAREVMDLQISNPKLRYIRFDKYSEGEIPCSSSTDFNIGFREVAKGKDATVITYGYYTNRLLNLIPKLRKLGCEIQIIDLFSIPFCEEKLAEALSGAKKIFTIEEHVLQGGIGSVILEFLHDKSMLENVKLKRLGIDYKNEYPSVFGNREYFMDKFGLSDETLIEELVK